MTPIRKALVALLALALLGTVSLGASRDASAAQNAPSWSTGNQWTYSSTLLSTPVTIVMAVKGQTSLTIGTTTYPVWDLNVSTTASSSGGSISIYTDVWLTVDGIKEAKTSSNFLVPTTSTYDRPEPQFVFPLAPGDSWSGTTTVNTTTNSGTTSTQRSYSGTVTAEQTVTVAAGTFATEVVKSPASGTSYTLTYYSDQVGNAVKTETYFLGALTGSENLTSYSYSPASTGILGIPIEIWIVILVVALVVIVGAVLMFRRRPRTPYPMQPPAGQQPPYQPPQQPPQQGPPGP